MRIIIPMGRLAAEFRARAIREIEALPDTKSWLVQAQTYRMKRSLEQNAYLHAVPLKMIADLTGYNIDEVKDHLLGEAFGWEEYTVFGTEKRRPVRRSHDLNTEEFSWWMEWIEAWASENLDMVVPRPGEVIT